MSKNVRVIIRFIEKPIPYYSVSGRGWADVAATPEQAIQVAARHVGLADDEDIAMRIAWEGVPDDFLAPDITFIDQGIPELPN